MIPNQYIYEPIKDINEIRILTILPQRTQDIECTVQHASYSGTSYQALSYCWGDDTREYPVTINNQICYVRHNLWRFLDNISQHLHDDATLVIWIDALCINQDDEDEKTAQVAQMGKIYERAAGVLIWLGEDQTVYSLFASLQSEAWDVVQDPLTWPPGIDRSSHADWRLAELSRHDYWYRLWIIQEVVLSRYSPQLLCCDLTVSWDQLFAKVHTSRWLHVEHSTGFNRFLNNKLWSLMLVRREFQMHKSQPGNMDTSEDGYRITGNSESSKCSNHKDRIFGIIGLIQPFASRTTVPGTYRDDITLLACKALVYYPHYFELHRLITSLEVSAQDMLAYLHSLRKERTLLRLPSVEIREQDKATHNPFQPDWGRSSGNETTFPLRPRWAIRLTEYLKIFVDFQRQGEVGDSVLGYRGISLEVSVRQDFSLQTWRPDSTHLSKVQSIVMNSEAERYGGEAAGELQMPLSTFAWIFKIAIKAHLIQQSIEQAEQAAELEGIYTAVEVEIETLDVIDSIIRLEY